MVKGGIPFFGHVFQLLHGSVWDLMTDWMLQYGTVFKFHLFGSDMICISDPEILKIMLSTKLSMFKKDTLWTYRPFMVNVRLIFVSHIPICTYVSMIRNCRILSANTNSSAACIYRTYFYQIELIFTSPCSQHNIMHKIHRNLQTPYIEVPKYMRCI